MLNIYKASAGAGKTYTLTKEYIKLLFKKENNYRKTLAVTFTNNACDEMKSRILEALYELSYNPKAAYLEDLMEIEHTNNICDIQEKAHRIFRDLLHNYSFFFIETIDSFTQRVIRNFAKDLNLPPKFSLELDPDTILETIIRKLLTNSAENPELHKLLIDFAFEDIDSNKQTNLKKEIKQASKLLFEEKFQAENVEIATNDFDTILQGMHTFFDEQTGIIKNYEKLVCGYANQAIDVINKAGLSRDDFKKSGKASCIDVLKKIANKDFSKSVEKILTAEMVTTKKLDAGKRMTIELLYSQTLENLLNELQHQLEDTNAKQTYYTAKKYVQHKQGIILSQYIQSELEAYCRDENAFFLSFANMLLKGIINKSDTPFVYEKIGQQIENIMIDEFQDTSNMQWDNFKPIISNLLAAQDTEESSGYGLIIGDVKQSIYRFRNGDWNILHNLTNSDSQEFTINDHSNEIKTNFRSYKNVIEFNNAFFKAYSKFVDSRFNTNYGTEKDTISSIYDDCAQKTKKDSEGCVEIQLINADGSLKANEAKELRLELIFNKVVSLLQQGRNAEDIMILCYRNDTIGEIVQYFNTKKNEEQYKDYENAFSIMSKQALLIDAAPSIQFIINFLRKMTMKDDDKGMEFVKASLAFNYQTLFPESATSESLLDFGTIPDKVIGKNMSIFDTCEQIIMQYKLNEITAEIPFITNFQDIVHSYSKNYNTNISHFLEHWDEIKGKTYLSQSKRIGSLQAATIHSSKGLQYPVVILPDFAKTSAPQYAHALYKTDDNRLPIVELEGDMKETLFKDEFIEEMYLTEIDNINALYVACTRAEEELYIFDTCSSKDAKNKVQFFDEVIANIPSDEYNDYTFRKGTAKGSTKNEKQSNSLEHYVVYQPAARLLPEKNSRHFEDRLNQPQTQREHGLLMHQILEHITTMEDIDRCILQYSPIELMDIQERNELASSLREKLANPRVAPWFTNNWDSILTEQPLMLPNGIEKRPDRMLVRGKDITVIDYKFTKEHEESHIKQVREYMHILSQMGYTTKGYIWYVDLNDIVDVA